MMIEALRADSLLRTKPANPVAAKVTQQIQTGNLAQNEAPLNDSVAGAAFDAVLENLAKEDSEAGHTVADVNEVGVS